MKLTEISIKKPVFAWMIMTAFIVFGSMAFVKMGVSEKPDIDFPVASISIDWEGAAPEVVELDIIDSLESSLLSVEGIKSITSEARRGRANISVEFGLDKDIDVAIQEIQSVLGQAQRRLPTDIQPPIVRKSNPEDRPILWLSVTSDKMTKKELMTYARDFIKDRFMTVKGVSEVILGGYVEPNLRVWVSDKSLKAYDLTALDVMNAIAKEHSEIPSGIYENTTTEFNVRLLGEAQSLEDFSRLSINSRGGAPNYTPIPLARVATIEDGLEDIRRLTRVNGVPSLGLGIKKQRGANSVEVGHGIKARLTELKGNLPPGMNLGVNYDGTTFIEESMEELKFTLVLSAILTALVVWIFLGSWSTTFNIILSIPTAIIGTFIGLKLFGFTLNTFTMLGLTLAVGLIVDDNIMVLENITRVYQQCKDRVMASIEGTREIAFAALAASTAIMAIFLPIGLMSGIIGKYFFQFAVTICVAIFFSYIDAVTLTPMRTSLFMGEDKKQGRRAIDRLMNRLESAYKRALSWCLTHKWKVLISSLLIFSSTFIALTKLKKEFVPPQDEGRLFIIMKAPPGSSLEYTDNKVKEVEKILMSRPEIERYLVSIGGFSGGESNSAMSFVTLKQKHLRPVNPEKGKVLSQQELADALKAQFRKIEGLFTMVQDPSLSGLSSGRSYPIEFRIIGPEWGQLISLSEKLKKLMLDSDLVKDADSSFKGEIPEIALVPDRDKAIARGVSVNDIGRTIGAMIGGVVAGKYAKGGHRYDIRLKIKSEEFKELKDLSRLMIRNNRGELVPLSQLVKIEERKGMLSIIREERSRAVSLFGNLAPGASQADTLDYIKAKAKEILPAGYAIEESGSAKAFKDSFKDIYFVFFVGILVAYMVLASQFNSFIHPLTILLSLPFSVTGAFFALWIFGQSLNIYSLIGLILLMGIVKKNAIILVDFTNQMRDKGLSVQEALLEACPIRLRPILMTSISTLAGTMPAALALGPGAESRVPMALSVIGGLMVSTLLTIFVIPCFYLVCSRKKTIKNEAKALHLSA